ncbi:MAG: hypothetical protein L0Y48_02085 [Fusobacteria bacterium]|nr:hypothetical protein [Fusobacteriota bacterium]
MRCKPKRQRQSSLCYRLEAIRIELTGKVAANFDIYYRVHIQNYGRLCLAKNGQDSGSLGLGMRLEGIEVMVVPKQ